MSQTFRCAGHKALASTWTCVCGAIGNGLMAHPLHRTPAGALCCASIPHKYKAWEEIEEHEELPDGTRYMVRRVVWR